MIASFFEAIFQFYAILSPSNDVELLDEYCTGMTFGLQGSKVLVSIANVFIDKDGKLNKSPLDLDLKDVENKMKEIEGSIYRTASNTFADRSEKLRREREEL